MLKENEHYKINKDTNCHEWLYRIENSGYGRKRYKGRMWAAHRVSYDLNKGPIPKGLYVLHKCDNRKCINPDHLWLGTAKDNAEDRIIKAEVDG